MDKKTAELIKENKGLLRQLTFLNNKITELEGKVKKLEEEGSYFTRVESIKEAIRINV